MGHVPDDDQRLCTRAQPSKLLRFAVSLVDESLFRSAAIAGHNHLTDVYLLGLAVARHGKLATFDRRISIKAIVGAGQSNLEVIEAVMSDG